MEDSLTTTESTSISQGLNASNCVKKEYLYKILVVGDLGTGKTSIIKRYVHNIFSMHYKSTVRLPYLQFNVQFNNSTFR